MIKIVAIVATVMLALVAPATAESTDDIAKLKEIALEHKHWSEVVIPEMRDQRCDGLSPVRRRAACILSYNDVSNRYKLLQSHMDARVMAFSLQGDERKKILKAFTIDSHNASVEELKRIASLVNEAFPGPRTTSTSTPTVKPTPTSGPSKKQKPKTP